MKIDPRPGQRRKILIIEDDSDIRNFLKMLFAQYSYEVETSDSGLTGLASFAHFMPDIIILDLAMPDMDGMTFLARRGQIGRIKDIPILVLSARDGHGDVVGAMTAGAAAYIAKPFDNAKLLATVKKLAGPAIEPEAASTRVSW